MAPFIVHILTAHEQRFEKKITGCTYATRKTKRYALRPLPPLIANRARYSKHAYSPLHEHYTHFICSFMAPFIVHILTAHEQRFEKKITECTYATRKKLSVLQISAPRIANRARYSKHAYSPLSPSVYELLIYFLVTSSNFWIFFFNNCPMMT